MPMMASEHRAAERKYAIPILVAHHLEASLTCDAVRSLANDSYLYQIATAYLGGRRYAVPFGSGGASPVLKHRKGI
jgi:hypothetical protein